MRSEPFSFINILNIVAMLLRKRMQLVVNQIYVVVDRTNIDIITNETKRKHSDPCARSEGTMYVYANILLPITDFEGV